MKLIQSIPDGYVMTYGQIARLAGSPRGARQVVRILHSLSGKHRLPWHRVVNARGELAIQNDEARSVQLHCLQSEGVLISGDGRVDLEQYRFEPNE